MAKGIRSTFERPLPRIREEKAPRLQYHSLNYFSETVRAIAKKESRRSRGEYNLCTTKSTRARQGMTA